MMLSDRRQVDPGPVPTCQFWQVRPAPLNPGPTSAGRCGGVTHRCLCCQLWSFKRPETCSFKIQFIPPPTTPQTTTISTEMASTSTFIPAASPSPPPPDRALPEGYTLHPGYPPIPAYLHLRAASGLSPKTPAQAVPIRHNSWYGCYITFTPPPPADQNQTTPETEPTTSTETETVAMGRIIGDGGWYFHIADMAVLPDHQRRGLGDAVLRNLVGHIRAHAPRDGEGAYVTLFADAPGRRLYGKAGFVETGPSGQMGLMLPMGWEGR